MNAAAHDDVDSVRNVVERFSLTHYYDKAVLYLVAAVNGGVSVMKYIEGHGYAPQPVLAYDLVTYGNLPALEHLVATGRLARGDLFVSGSYALHNYRSIFEATLYGPNAELARFLFEAFGITRADIVGRETEVLFSAENNIGFRQLVDRFGFTATEIRRYCPTLA